MNEIKLGTPKGIRQNHFFALRVFDTDGNQVLYRSTRLGTLDVKEINVPGEYLGFDYELKDINELKVVSSGKIEIIKEKKSEKSENLKDGTDV